MAGVTANTIIREEGIPRYQWDVLSREWISLETSNL